MEKRVELFPHNVEVYNELNDTINNGFNRVAIIQPTGTGKRFIVTRLLQENPSLKKLILSPSNHINLQFKKLQTEKEMEKTTFMTYQKLNNINVDKLKNLTYDMIILDEFHRCGAPQWRKSIEGLLSANHKSLVIGTTATSKRHQDGGKNMDEELFDGVSIGGMTLAEAIRIGILPMPKYITALYSPVDEVQKRVNKIEASFNNFKDKRMRKQKLEKIKTSFFNSYGIPNILKKHLPSQNGKFIVFCKDISHQTDMVDVVSNWFLVATGNSPVNYIVNTSIASNRGTIEAFTNVKGPGIHLLYAVDMLNEGIHIESTEENTQDLTGVIFLRDTESPIVFFQQLGRGLSVGNKTNPIIFDFVNNVNLPHATEFRKELLKTRGKYSKKDSTDNTIFIYDETIDFLSELDQVTDGLIDSWSHNHGLLTEYIKTYGNTLVPGDYIIDNVRLGNWVDWQRVRYHNGKMSPQRIEKLNEIGFTWNVFESAWETKYNLLLQYLDSFGDLLVPSDYEMNGEMLGAWINTQRDFNKRHKLSEEKIEKLDSIGFIWDHGQFVWNKMFRLLKDYIDTYGDSLVRYNYEADDFNLYNWVSLNRQAYKEKTINDERIKKLNEVNFIWDTTDYIWHQNYQLLLDYIKKFGNNVVPKPYEVHGVKLGTWVNNQRNAYKNKKISDEKIKLLDDIGFVLNVVEYEWERKYNALVNYKDKHGTTKVPKPYEIDGIKLGFWVSRQRQFLKQDKLTDTQIEKLKNVEFLWSLS